MNDAPAGKLTFRRVFPRFLRLLLTLLAVALVGFYWRRQRCQACGVWLGLQAAARVRQYRASGRA